MPTISQRGGFLPEQGFLSWNHRSSPTFSKNDHLQEWRDAASLGGLVVQKKEPARAHLGRNQHERDALSLRPSPAPQCWRVEKPRHGLPQAPAGFSFEWGRMRRRSRHSRPGFMRASSWCHHDGNNDSEPDDHSSNQKIHIPCRETPAARCHDHGDGQEAPCNAKYDDDFHADGSRHPPDLRGLGLATCSRCLPCRGANEGWAVSP
jgi:hypothetical protein